MHMKNSVYANCVCFYIFKNFIAELNVCNNNVYFCACFLIPTSEIIRILRQHFAFMETKVN